MENETNSSKFQFKLGEYFQEGWRIFSENLGVLIGIVLIGLGIIIILAIPTVFAFVFAVTELTQKQVTIGFLGIILGSLGIVIFIATSILYQIALILALKNFYNAKKISIKEAFVASFPKFWVFLGAQILVFIFVFFGIIFLIIPGLILSVYFHFVSYLIIDEDLGVWAAIKRSWQIVSGKFWYVVLFIIIIGLINMAASSVVSLVAMIFMPFFMAVTFSFYRRLKNAYK